MSSKSYDKAILAYEKAIELDPNFSRPHDNKGTVNYI